MMYHEPQKHDTNAIPRMGDAADLLLNAISEHQPESHESLLSSDINLVMSINSMPIIPEECTTIIGVEDPLRRDPAIQDRLGESILSNGGQWIKMSAKFRRWGMDGLVEDGEITDRGWKSITNAASKSIDRLISVIRANRNSIPWTAEETLFGWPTDTIVKANAELARQILKPRLSRMVSDTVSLSRDSISFSDRWSPVSFTGGLDWSFKGTDRSWQSCFLSLDFLRHPIYFATTFLFDRDRIDAILASYPPDSGGTGELTNAFFERLIRKIIMIVDDFIESNPAGRSSAARCWHEGTATKRLSVLLGTYALLYKQPFLDRNQASPYISRLHGSILQHLALITDPIQYMEQGNHGLRQDVYLHVAGIIINNITGTCTWTETAKSRIRNMQLDPGLGPDGAWCEHSTGYHIYVLKLLRLHLKVSRLAADDEHCNYLVDVMRRMIRHLSLVLDQNFEIPLIGDSSTDLTNQKDFLANLIREVQPNEPEVRCESSNCEDELKNHLASGFDRSGWYRARGKAGFDVLFHAQLNSARHKHADDLSFVVQRSGIDWIVDPGVLNKEVGDRMRDHFRLDASAHNTYTVNGLSYPFKKMKRRTVLDHHFEGEGWSAASGINERYADGSVRRTMLVLHEVGSIVIIDSLLARKRPCAWTSHLHFGLEIMAKKTGDQSILATASSGETMHIDYHGAAANLSIISGQQDPPLGWLETGWSKTAPAPVAVNELHGDEVVSAMHITFGDSPCPAEVALLGKNATVTLDTATDKASRWMIEAKTGDVKFASPQNE